MADETRETFEALLSGLKAEGVAPTAQALAEASGLSEEDAAEILAEIQKKESQHKKRKPEKTAEDKPKPKLRKRPAAAKAKVAASPQTPPEEPVTEDGKDAIAVPDSPEVAATQEDTPQDVLLNDAQLEDTQAAEFQHQLEKVALEAMVSTHGPPPASPSKTFAVTTPERTPSPEKSQPVPQARFASVSFIFLSLV